MLNLDENTLISEDLVKMLSFFKDFSVEFGGSLFGFDDGGKHRIMTFSSKKGDAFSITFDFRDERLFCAPEGMVVCGTWHIHPDGISPRPSTMDIIQWKKWSSCTYHIILNNKKLVVYKKGLILSEVNFKKE